jgi:hypothetical protein
MQLAIAELVVYRGSRGRGASLGRGTAGVATVDGRRVRCIAARYDRRLPTGGAAPVVRPGNSHVHPQDSVRVPAARRAAIQRRLHERGVPIGVSYPTCRHEQPVLAALRDALA